jgi:hypothetical protein
MAMCRKPSRAEALLKGRLHQFRAGGWILFKRTSTAVDRDAGIRHR